MAKVTIVGDAVVITSSVKLADLETIAKYRPEALVLKGGEDGKEPIFGISVKQGDGEINKYGANFASETHDEAKLAAITVGVNNAGGGDIKEYVAEQIGSAIINLNKLEETLPKVLEEITAEKDSIMNSISVVQ